MKKSLLALAVLAATVSVNAATVYDKDGVSLKADGRVQAVIYNGANKLAVKAILHYRIQHVLVSVVLLK